MNTEYYFVFDLKTTKMNIVIIYRNKTKLLLLRCVNVF